MEFKPARRLGLFTGFLFLAALLAAIATGLYQIGTAPLSAGIIVWTFFPVAGVPLLFLTLYHLYGLITASYRLDRNGFYLRWGLYHEQIPLASVLDVHRSDELAAGGRAPMRWWPGLTLGTGHVGEVGEVQCFGTHGLAEALLLRTAGRALLISPADTGTFQQAFRDATRLGALEQISARSQRPDFAIADFWAQIPARWAVLVGLLLPLLMLGYIALRLPDLPASVPFGFTPTGSAGLLAPPGRLLLLPMVAGLCWLVDFVLGVWFFRRERNRPVAYLLWLVSILVSGLLWGAVAQLMDAA
jgi:hypothetical protein